MLIEQHLAALAQLTPADRRSALTAVLESEGFVYTTQAEEETEQNPRPAINYLLLPPGDDPCPLFCAHYDAHPGSQGGNDNTAAVCILIELAKTLRQRGVRAAFAFFDGEESGHTGAKLFETERTREFSVVVNLDMCGYGDTIALYCKGGAKQPAAAVFCDKKRLSAHGGTLVAYLPEGDDTCFPTRRQPVLSLAIMPKWDTKYLASLSKLGSGFLGHPPEVEMILGQMEVVTTMHGGFRDGAKWVQPTAMQQVYDYLLDAVCAPLPKKRRFF